MWTPSSWSPEPSSLSRFYSLPRPALPIAFSDQAHWHSPGARSAGAGPQGLPSRALASLSRENFLYIYQALTKDELGPEVNLRDIRPDGHASFTARFFTRRRSAPGPTLLRRCL